MGVIKLGNKEYKSSHLYVQCGFNGGSISVGTGYAKEEPYLYGSKTIVSSMGPILYQLTGKNVQVEHLKANSLALLEGRVGYAYTVDAWVDGNIPSKSAYSQYRKVSPSRFNSTVSEIKSGMRLGKPIMRRKIAISGYFQMVSYEIDDSGIGELLLNGEVLTTNCQNLIVRGNIEYLLSCRSLYVKM